MEKNALVRNDVDRFIEARLEKEPLAPAPEASPAVLIRRLTFDLTGLPPSFSNCRCRWRRGGVFEVVQAEVEMNRVPFPRAEPAVVGREGPRAFILLGFRASFRLC